ncbi:Flp family type IVb pilin [Segeticoccus rhizosphaerae]|uniref:Flp family type IVb pilin n=1 Tax=Segeticoccus rhizosphaerae TaxID=1104777 RepID=UPI0010C0B34A|nr:MULTISPECIES: Flp family type IVb pilin [Intrasporangiaceae]
MIQRYSTVSRHGDRGATAVEYALMAGLIAGMIIAMVTVVGIRVQGLFASVPPF